MLVPLFGCTNNFSPFVTIWQTDHEGRSKNNQITSPAKGNYSIVWQEVGKPKNQGKATSVTVACRTSWGKTSPGNGMEDVVVFLIKG